MRRSAGPPLGSKGPKDWFGWVADLCSLPRVGKADAADADRTPGGACGRPPSVRVSHLALFALAKINHAKGARGEIGETRSAFAHIEPKSMASL